ncbi:hypothetical protein ACP70R_037358 [Stipagrostis hirtigluma subsp. patula]
MNETSSVEASVEATLSTVRAEVPQRRTQPVTIFRVPAYLRESNRTAYEPRMVSIGPYYHGATTLRAMEDHKWRYLHDLLSRNPMVSSSMLIQEMRSLEPRARACYSERPLLGSDDFVQMLLLDGCFILEFFKLHDKTTNGGGPNPLYDVGWGRTLIATDLLLMENQIPFFVVERLYYNIAGVQGSWQLLVNLLLEYISEVPLNTQPSNTGKIHHLLHLCYECSVPKWRPTAAGPKEKPGPRVKVIPSATEMSAAGVTFVRRSSPRDMYDVTFDAEHGVMKIPAVVVDDMKRPLLVNLIAFEQSQGVEEARVVTSYVSLMGMLARTAQDVELLYRHGVVENLLADSKEAARFFSHLGDGSAMDYDRQVFAGLYDDLQRFCRSWWPRHRAALSRDYFGSPWSAISFFVAGFVVVLTALQAYFAVFPRK